MTLRSWISSIHTLPDHNPARRMRRSAANGRAWAVAAACAFGIPLATPAKADQLNVTSVSVPLYDSGINISYGSTTWTGVIAGQIVLHSTNSATPSAPAFNVAAWCVDLFHEIYLGNNAYAFYIGTAVTTDGNSHAISAATNKKLMTLGAYGNSLLATTYAGNANVSSAIQLAIWQTEYSGLTFTANSTVTGFVTTFEAYANSHTLTGSLLSPLGGQQQLITNSVAPAPEPISLSLLATGLIGLGFVRRRTR